jgi:methyl-accepting chemotaxis protein
MLNNISVTTKGLIAFTLLAAIAIASSIVIYNRTVVANDLVVEADRIQTLADAVAEFSDDIYVADLQLKSFLLTGNRAFAETVESLLVEMQKDVTDLTTLFREQAPAELPALEASFATLAQWQTQFVKRQVDLMRVPDTVELARASDKHNRAFSR